MKHLIQKIIWYFGYDLSKLNNSNLRIKELIEDLKPITVINKELVRIGSDSDIDGNYLVPNDLNEIEYCFSLGVGNSSQFEIDLADRGIKSFLADYSVDELPEKHKNLVFDKKFIDSYNSETTITFQDWKDKYLKDYNKDMIMQMDIEGYEYKILLDMPIKLLKQFRIIVIEFHFLTRLFDLHSNQFLYSSLKKLTEHFKVTHIHPNNHSPTLKKDGIEIPHMLEITFLRNDRVKDFTYTSVFPHPLDIPCIRNKSEVVLPKHWYS